MSGKGAPGTSAGPTVRSGHSKGAPKRSVTLHNITQLQLNLGNAFLHRRLNVIVQYLIFIMG
jgi:hypothetical protein